MGKKRNSVFSEVVPVMGASQTTTPISMGADAIARHKQALKQPFGAETGISLLPQHGPDGDLSVRYSTGSTLLDSFVQEQPSEVFALQEELMTLSLALNRIAAARLSSTQSQSAQASPPAELDSASESAIKTKRNAIALARQQAQYRAQQALQQAKQLAQRQNRTGDHPGANVGQLANPLKNGQAGSPRRLDHLSNPTHRPDTADPSIRQQIVSRGLKDRFVGGPTQTAQPLPSASPTPASPTPVSSTVKVFGGEDYKAMQARAQAGGLVNLDDSLLFGGTERSKGTSKQGNSASDSEFLIWLAQPLEDFTLSPIPGGWHPTAHLESTANMVGSMQRTVLGIDSFKLDALELEHIDSETETPKSTVYADSAYSDSASESEAISPAALDDLIEEGADEMATLDLLGKQVSHLNKRIEFLTKRLADMTGAQTARSRPSKRTASVSSVVLAVDAAMLGDANAVEHRTTTLGPFINAM